MPEPRRTARDLFAEALRLLLAKDMTGYAGLWAVDGIMEFPFAPPNYPSRLDGRAAIQDYLRGYPDLLDVQAITGQTVRETTDPDVVVAEFEAAGVVVAGPSRSSTPPTLPQSPCGRCWMPFRTTPIT
jgi:ketosteroid isomerase-like protein